MAKEFFSDLPDTSTPLRASRLNGLLDGEEPLGNIVVDSIRSKNMLNINTIINGKLNTSTGAYETADYILVSNYIYMKAGTYTIKINNPNSFYLHTACSYNSSKTFVSTLWQDTTLTQKTFTLNSEGYVRFCFRKDNYPIITPTDIINTNIQVELGSIPTTYMPYQNLDGMENYSTNEVVIGTWTNGKPIYRQIFTGNIVHDDTLLTNVDTLINGYGSGIVSNRYRLLGFSLYSNNQRYDFAVNKNTSNQVKAEIYAAGSTTTATQCNVVLEYTKTTD